MNYNRIISLQKAYGYTDMQNMINNGMAWKLEGSIGRCAMDYLKAGVCMLPKIKCVDAYGNIVPSRDSVEKGTTGSYQNSKDFWIEVDNGNIDLDEGI